MVTTAVPSGSRSVLDILKRSTGSSEGGEVIVNETPALSKEEKHPVLSPVPATQVVKPAVTDRHPATSVVPAAAQERPAAHPGERPGGLIPMLFNRSSNSREATPVATPTVTKAMAPVPSTPKMIMAGPSLEMPPARPMPQAPMNPIQPVSAKLDPEPAQPLFGKPVAEPTAPKSSSYQVVGRQDVQPPKPVVVPAYEPAKPRLVSSDAGTPHWLTVLRDDRAPSKREMAAVKLASTEPAAVGSVVPALLTAMKSDAAPAVRIACIRSLDKLKVCAPEVLVGLDAMLSDADAKVQQEASQALAHLLATPTVTSARPVQGGGPFTR
jgi:hypothetical protein